MQPIASLLHVLKVAVSSEFLGLENEIHAKIALSFAAANPDIISTKGPLDTPLWTGRSLADAEPYVPRGL